MYPLYEKGWSRPDVITSVWAIGMIALILEEEPLARLTGDESSPETETAHNH